MQYISLHEEYAKGVWNWGPTEIWTRIAGFKVQSANHYTIGPQMWCGDHFQFLNFDPKIIPRKQILGSFWQDFLSEQYVILSTIQILHLKHLHFNHSWHLFKIGEGMMFPLLSLEGVCGRQREETKAVRGEATPAGAICQMQHALEVLRICTEKKRIMIISDISGTVA